MKKEPKSSKLYGTLVLYEMHTDFLLRALDGIAQTDAQKRLDTKANHIAWITGSMVQGRFFLAESLGKQVQSKTGDLFVDNKGIIDEATYPTLEAFKEDWNLISPILLEVLQNADEAQLTSKFEMPGMDMTYFDMISFTAYREANCIGQIALWRRLLGYPGMNYM